MEMAPVEKTALISLIGDITGGDKWLIGEMMLAQEEGISPEGSASPGVPDAARKTCVGFASRKVDNASRRFRSVMFSASLFAGCP